MSMKDDIEWTLFATSRRERYMAYAVMGLLGAVLILVSALM